MNSFEVFFWGFGGSIAVEIVTLINVFESEPLFIPDRYRRLSFWLVRTLLAVVAGGLAIAYDIQKPLLAANIGAATPLIIKALAQGVQTSAQTAFHIESFSTNAEEPLPTTKPNDNS